MLKGIFSVKAGLRFIHTSSFQQAVKKNLLSKLRKKTGFPFINCKKALEKFDNDLPQAEKWLRDEAQKEGWSKATKLQGRPMSQGLVGLMIENNTAALVEINCETDFVARNPKFQRLVSGIASSCLQQGKAGAQGKTEIGKESLSKIQVEDGQTVSDAVAMVVGNLGENMAARRGLTLQHSGDVVLGTYIHAAGGQQMQDGQCQLGKYGALITMQQTNSSSTDTPITNLARQLCQHVVGMNPKSIGSPDDAPLRNKDDETRMIFQEYLLDPEVTVGEVLQQNFVQVVDFARFECGEVLPGDEDA